jgi:hypothetical protein
MQGGDDSPQGGSEQSPILHINFRSQFASKPAWMYAASPGFLTTHPASRPTGKVTRWTDISPQCLMDVRDLIFFVRTLFGFPFAVVDL